LKINDRIIVVRAIDYERPGGRAIPIKEKGTVIELSQDTIGIAFDDAVGGHNCNGKCDYNHGWRVPISEGYVELLLNEYHLDDIVNNIVDEAYSFKGEL